MSSMLRQMVATRAGRMCQYPIAKIIVTKTVVFVTAFCLNQNQAVDKDKHPRQNVYCFGRFLSHYDIIIGYVRVSSDDQNLDAQNDALTTAGAERIFADKISGSKPDRAELGKMLDQLRSGDVVQAAVEPIIGFWGLPQVPSAISYKPSLSLIWTFPPSIRRITPDDFSWVNVRLTVSVVKPR